MSYFNTQFHSAFIALTLAITFQSCNKVQISEVDVSGNTSAGISDSDNNTNSVDYSATTPPPDTGLVMEACANLPQTTISTAYQFPKPQQTCAWEVGGNLNPRNNYFQARIEQEQQFQLEQGAIICDIRFNFAEQKYLYDDHFLLTFNDAVIASSYNFESKLDLQYGLLSYDWSRLAGMFWDNKKEGVYCAANALCSWPKTDTPGLIMMNFPSVMFQRMMAENISRTAHSMKFISIGDNDNLDCEHSDVNFNLEVTYVIKR